MELRHYLALLRRWWWLLLLGPLLAALPAYFVTGTVAPTYRAATTIFVNQSAAPGAITYNDALLNQQLVKTYSQMARQPIVLDEVGLLLERPVDPADVTVQAIRDTQLFQISVEGHDPARVRDVANTIAQVFIEQQTPYLPAGQVPTALRVAQPALKPVDPVGPRLGLNLGLACLLGLLAAAAVVALLEYLDDTVKSGEDLEAVAGLATLGAVTRLDGADGTLNHLLPPTPVRTSAAAESYRLVRTNLDFAGAGTDRKLRTVLVTSASPQEGKSTTVANLGTVIAQAGKRVVIIDADLRKPSQHRLFGLSNDRGLSTLLLEGCSNQAADYLQPSPVQGLQILPSGPLPPNPAELLSTPVLGQALEQLLREVDLVLIDSPPVLGIADPIVLSGCVDGTVLVVDAARTRADALKGATEALSRSGTRVLGAVLNKLHRRDSSSPYYTYYGADEPEPALRAAPSHAGFLKTRLQGFLATVRRGS